MPAYYLDTSALVKGYTAEVGSGWIVGLLDPNAHNDLFTVRITGAELVAAVYRKVRSGTLQIGDAAQITAAFQADWQLRYQLVEVEQVRLDRAIQLLEQHRLRGYDAVHLAAALAVDEMRQIVEAPRLPFSFCRCRSTACCTHGRLGSR